MSNKGRLYTDARNVLNEREDVVDVRLDEEFNPPHKPAAFSPYDIVLQLSDPIYPGEDEWTEENVAAMLSSHGVTFDKVINVEDDKHSDDVLVFISLEEF